MTELWLKGLNYVLQTWCKNQKKNRKSLKIKDLRFRGYPDAYLFSNQFMEDLGRIYQLRKYFPSFDDTEKTEGTKQSAD